LYPFIIDLACSTISTHHFHELLRLSYEQGYLNSKADKEEEYENLELDIKFNGYETIPRNVIVSVDSVEHARSIIKGYKGDNDFQHANLYDVKRIFIDLD